MTETNKPLDQSKTDTITIAFYKGDIVHTFPRKTDNVECAVIAFPKSSVYAGYVWYYPVEWIKSNDEQNKNDSAYSFSPDKRWIRINKDNDIYISKNEKNEETGEWEVVDRIRLFPEDVKQSMKRPFTLPNADDSDTVINS